MTPTPNMPQDTTGTPNNSTATEPRTRTRTHDNGTASAAHEPQQQHCHQRRLSLQTEERPGVPTRVVVESRRARPQLVLASESAAFFGFGAKTEP